MSSPAILIFNQEEAIRDSLNLILSEEGFDCASGDDQVWMYHSLTESSVKLIILDTHTKVLFDLLGVIKAANPISKVLLISSYSESEIIEKALASGAHDFILKPLDFDELIIKVKELLLPSEG